MKLRAVPSQPMAMAWNCQWNCLSWPRSSRSNDPLCWYLDRSPRAIGGSPWTGFGRPSIDLALMIQMLRLLRIRCAGCGCIETGVSWLSHRRSAPELDQLSACLAALAPNRVAAGVLVYLLPAGVGRSPETSCAVTLEIDEPLGGRVAIGSVGAVSAITIAVGSTFISSCGNGGRHSE